MSHAELIAAYNRFMETARHYVELRSEDDYQRALASLEELMESAEDSSNEPLNPLIDMLCDAIEHYEEQDEEVRKFVAEAEAIPTEEALQRTLEANYNLTDGVNDKTMVSKVLKNIAEKFGVMNPIEEQYYGQDATMRDNTDDISLTLNIIKRTHKQRRTFQIAQTSL